MSSWTKVSDTTTDYGKSEGGYNLTTLDGKFLTTEGGVELTREGVTTDYTEVADSFERYTPFGVGLKIATELFNWILTEDKLIRLVHSRTVYTDVGDQVTIYTKVSDE